jgi:hypothetical protein
LSFFHALGSFSFSFLSFLLLLFIVCAAGHGAAWW